MGLNPIWSGGGAESARTCILSTVAARRTEKVGVMGYVNSSYYIGKTPKKVLGAKEFLGPVQRPAKLGRPKIMEPRNLYFFYFGLKF